jgi:hypothetical protein
MPISIGVIPRDRVPERRFSSCWDVGQRSDWRHPDIQRAGLVILSHFEGWWICVIPSGFDVLLSEADRLLEMAKTYESNLDMDQKWWRKNAQHMIGNAMNIKGAVLEAKKIDAIGLDIE